MFFCCYFLKSYKILNYSFAIVLTVTICGIIMILLVHINGYLDKYNHDPDLYCVNCGRQYQQYLRGECCSYSYNIGEYNCVSYTVCRQMELEGKQFYQKWEHLAIALTIIGSIGTGIFIIAMLLVYKKQLERRKKAERRLQSLLIDQINYIAVQEGIKQKLIQKQKPSFSDNSTSCSIRLMEFDNYLLIKTRDTCRHKFHQKCLKQWQKRNSSCPICRRD